VGLSGGARGGGATATVGRVGGDRAQRVRQLGGIDLVPVAGAGQLEPLAGRAGEVGPTCAQGPAGGLGHELGRGADRGVHDGPAAGQRLERGQAEPLPAVGQHDGVGGAVERGEPVVLEVVGDVHDRRARRVGDVPPNEVVGRRVGDAGAEVLDDQADVVARGERPLPRVEQEVDALAGDRAPDEEERAAGVAGQVGDLAVGREALEVGALGDDLDDAGGHAAGDVAVADVPRRDDDPVELGPGRGDPGPGWVAELPRQDRDGRAVGPGVEHRRPDVADRGRRCGRGVLGRAPDDVVAAFLERLREPVVDDPQRVVAAEPPAPDARRGTQAAGPMAIDRGVGGVGQASRRCLRAEAAAEVLASRQRAGAGGCGSPATSRSAEASASTSASNHR
jgi:hypothetical protein